MAADEVAGAKLDAKNIRSSTALLKVIVVIAADGPLNGNKSLSEAMCSL